MVLVPIRRWGVCLHPSIPVGHLDNAKGSSVIPSANETIDEGFILRMNDGISADMLRFYNSLHTFNRMMQLFIVK